MYHNAMTPPATGEITPATKRQRTHPPSAAQAVTPCDVVKTLTIALQAATEAEMDDKEEETTNPTSDNTETNYDCADEPVLLWCSLLSLPPTFNSFADTISKKVTALLMTKESF
jgi:hypothetical protein